jgi:hypothetical protein
MASQYKKRIDKIINNSLTPLLKINGFRKSGSVFISQSKTVYWLVDIQKSRWNDKQEANFTLNCGIYIPEVVSGGYTIRKVPIRPSLMDCCLSVRIGILNTPPNDKWWNITNTNNEVEEDNDIISEIRASVTRKLLPFLKRFESQEKVLAFLTNPPSNISDKFVSPRNEVIRFIYAAFIYAGQGNTIKAKEAMKCALERTDKIKWPIIDIIAARLEQKINNVMKSK